MSRGVQHIHPVCATTDTVGGTTIGTTETAFAKTCPIPANGSNAHDFYLGFYTVKCTALNGSDTLTTKVYFGPASSPKTGIMICDQTAIATAAGATVGGIFAFSVDLLGTVSVLQLSAIGLSCATAATSVSKTLAISNATDAQVSSLVANVVGVTATWSASSAGNSAYLATLHVAKFPGLPSQ